MMENLNNNSSENNENLIPSKKRQLEDDLDNYSKKIKHENVDDEVATSFLNEHIENGELKKCKEETFSDDSNECDVVQQTVILKPDISDSDDDDEEAVKDKYICINGETIKEEDYIKVSSSISDDNIDSKILKIEDDSSKNLKLFSTDKLLGTDKTLLTKDQNNEKNNSSECLKNDSLCSTSNLLENNQTNSLDDQNVNKIDTSNDVCSKTSGVLPSNNVENSCKNIDIDSNDPTQQPSTSSNRRERCWYGEKCYRKDPSHKANFSHPPDSDWPPDPSDDRPDCIYGAACYRKNRMHRQKYKHPTNKPAPRSPNSHKRRAARLQNGTYDEIDDDLDDPYAGGSSSSDLEFDEDDYSDDSMDIGDSDEEINLLYKEAKKFKRQFNKK